MVYCPTHPYWPNSFRALIKTSSGISAKTSASEKCLMSSMPAVLSICSVCSTLPLLPSLLNALFSAGFRVRARRRYICLLFSHTHIPLFFVLAVQAVARVSTLHYSVKVGDVGLIDSTHKTPVTFCSPELNRHASLGNESVATAVPFTSRVKVYI